MVLPLDETIALDQVGHITTHDTIAAVLNGTESIRLPLQPVKLVDALNDTVFQIDAVADNSAAWFEFYRGTWLPNTADEIPLLSLAAVDPVGQRAQFVIGVMGSADRTQETAETGPLMNLTGNVEGALNVILQLTPIDSGAQFFRMSSAALGDPPRLMSVGPSTDVPMQIMAQNRGYISLMANYPAEVPIATFSSVVASIPNNVNWFEFFNAGPAGAIAMTAAGTDTDIGIVYTPKGTGKNLFNGTLGAAGDSGGLAGVTGFTNAIGVGDAGAVNLQTPAKGTGGGPTTMQVSQWLKVYVGATVGYVPWFE